MTQPAHPDDARRLAQHEAIKTELRNDVNREVAHEARKHAGERGDVHELGAELDRRAIREVASTESDVQKGRVAARAGQFLDYAFIAIYGLIGVEIVLEVTGAREANVFKRAIDFVSYPFLMPFEGLFRDPRIGEFRLMFSYIAALVAWLLLHLAVRGLLRLIATRQTSL